MLFIFIYYGVLNMFLLTYQGSFGFWKQKTYHGDTSDLGCNSPIIVMRTTFSVLLKRVCMGDLAHVPLKLTEDALW